MAGIYTGPVELTCAVTRVLIGTRSRTPGGSPPGDSTFSSTIPAPSGNVPEAIEDGRHPTDARPRRRLQRRGRRRHGKANGTGRGRPASTVGGPPGIWRRLCRLRIDFATASALRPQRMQSIAARADGTTPTISAGLPGGRGQNRRLRPTSSTLHVALVSGHRPLDF